MTEPFDLQRFAQMIGESPERIPASAQALLSEYALHYEIITGSERENCFLDALHKMQADLRVSGKHRQGDWEQGWSENLERFIESEGDPTALTPRYLQSHQIDRCQGNYIRSDIPYFQVKFYDVFRRFVFESYLSESRSVYEFGCGTGYNLTILAQLFPDKNLIGLDWAQASVRLINEIAKTHNYRLSGQAFDMFAPNPDLVCDQETAVITFNSMEQLGTNFKTFVDYLRQQKPQICVHAEPLLELYDESQLFDYLGASYHRYRGYLEGFVPYMQSLAEAGEIEIIKLQRIPFGNQFHEGYSLLVWKPIA